MGDRMCSVEGCERKHYALDLCNLHWKRQRKRGDPLYVHVIERLPCSVDGCDAKAIARGWCPLHWRRWRTTGDPGQAKPVVIVGDDVARFESKIKVGPVPDYAPELGPCWLWTEGIDPAGYGVFNVASPACQTAHRWSYMFHIGDIPDGLELDHLCRVRHCCNPYHLEPVTPAENKRRGVEARRGSDKRDLAPLGRTA